MANIIFIFVITSISLVLYGIWSMLLSQSQIRQRLPAQEADSRKKSFAGAYLAPIVSLSNALLEKLKIKEKVTQRLYAAHVRLSAAEFFTLKLVIMLVLTGLTYLIFNKILIPAVLIAFLVGYIVPEVWLGKRIGRRKELIVRLLPETVDLLALCMEAGLDFTTSMDWIVKKTRHTPMIEELAFVVEEINWGKPRLQALKDMAKRIDIQEIRSFVHTLNQAERMGTPVVEVLGILSEDTRMQRFNRGERIALQAPMKMLIPLIFCILPVIAIIVGGPILLQFMQGSMFKGF